MIRPYSLWSPRFSSISYPRSPHFNRTGKHMACRAEHLEPRRLLAFGDFDPSFGSGGHLAYDASPTNFLPYGDANERLLVLSDGHIIVAGYNALIERKPDGTIET